MKRIVIGTLWIALFFVHAPLLLAQDLSARLDREVVGEQETFRLILELSGRQAAGEPDFSPLERDFEILGTSRSQQMNLTEGKMSTRIQWNVTLAAKKTGELTLPPIRLGNATSNAVSVKVVPAEQAAQSGAVTHLFLEAEVDQERPYVQAQVVYTVRLFYAVDLKEAALSDPAPDNALIERLGEDVRYQTERDGKRYQVIERRYAIFPQASGELTIPSIRFSGSMPDTRQRARANSLFGGPDPFDRMFQATRPVRARTPEIRIDVQPRPTEARGAQWLPAQALDVSATWSPDPPRFRVGEPVTRTVTLLARGLTATQLPDVPLPADPALKVYPDQAVTHTSGQGIHIVGKRQQKLAVVPIRAGDYQLPEIRIPWWDTHADQLRVAVLPARTITVLPAQPSTAGATAPLTQPAPAPQLGSESLRPQQLRAEPQNTDRPQDKDAEAELNVWQAVAVLLLLVWLLTLVLWWRQQQGTQSERRQHPPPSAPIGSPGAARRRLKSACRAGDPQGARIALLDWATARWPETPPRGLEELARRLNTKVVRAPFRALDRRLYCATQESWDGMAFWKAVATELEDPSAGRSSRRQHLPELYPKRPAPAASG